MFFDASQQIDTSKFQSDNVKVKAGETKPIDINMNGYNWAGFKIPDGKKVFFMGQDIKIDRSLVFTFYNSETTDLEVTIIRY